MISNLFYIYDAYCGWCYGFSPVIRKIAKNYPSLPVEVLSGGMMLSERPVPVRVIAPYIRQHYRVVEERTGIRFGEDFLWHIFNPEKSDWFPDSLKPAVALCIFKDYHPDRQVEFATDLQFALHAEGRDLCDDEAYRGLLEKYNIPAKEFYDRLHQPAWQDKATAEFETVKKLRVTGFPALLLREDARKFHLLGSGYTEYHTLSSRIDQVLAILDRAGISKGRGN